MTEVASRELRNNIRGLLVRVGAGEEITITVDGHPMAELRPVGRRLRWIGRKQFVQQILSRQADPELSADLVELARDTTDELGP